MSDDLDKDDLEIIGSVFKRMEELNIEYEQDRQEYLNASKEEKLILMQEKMTEMVGTLAYHPMYRGTDDLENYANYEEYEKRYFSEVENKQQNYIEYLKCYCKSCQDSALTWMFESEEQIEIFIKQKCEESGFLDIFNKYSSLK